MKLVIDRSKWIRGDKSDSYLLRERDGKMCCLGFFGLACGLTQVELLSNQEPREVAKYDKWPEWLVTGDEEGPGGYIYWSDSDDAGYLIEANDSSEFDDVIREIRIARIFAAHGVEVEFIDGPVSP